MVLLVKLLLHSSNPPPESPAAFNRECVTFFFLSFCTSWSNLVVPPWEASEVDVRFDGMISYNARAKKTGEDGFSFGCVRISVVN